MKTNVITLEKLPLLKDEKRVGIKFIFLYVYMSKLGHKGKVSKKKKKIIGKFQKDAAPPPPPYWKIKKRRKMIYAP